MSNTTALPDKERVSDFISPEELSSIADSVLDQLAATATPKQQKALPKQQKALAIVRSVHNACKAISKAASSIPRYKLPRIAIAARRRRASAQMRLYITAIISAADVQMVATQPVPKYPEGSVHVPGEWALVGDQQFPEMLPKLA